MAKYNSLIFNEASGKMGAMVLSTNGIARRNVTPKNPRTPAQTAVREGFSAANAAWKALTPAQWAGWVALANQIALKDKAGKSYNPTGRRLFIACYQNSRTVGQDAPTAPPASVPSVPGVPNFAVTVSPAGTGHLNGLITVTGGYSIGGYMIVIRATPQYGADRQAVQPNAFRVLAASSDDSGPPAPDALAALYAARWGVPTTAAKISFETFQVDNYGFVGGISRADATVGATSEAAESGEPTGGQVEGLKMKKAA